MNCDLLQAYQYVDGKFLGKFVINQVRNPLVNNFSIFGAYSIFTDFNLHGIHS